MKSLFKFHPALWFVLLLFMSCEKSDDSPQANGGQTVVKSYDDGNWTQQTDFPGLARTEASSFSIGDKGYVICGWIDGASTKLGNEFWEYDKPTDSWTQKNGFPGAARNAATGFAIGNKGYLVCGWSADDMDNTKPGNQFWEWDQATDIWTQKTNFPGEPRLSATGFAIGLKGYMVCGWIENSPSKLGKEFWEWNQSTDTWTQKNDFPGKPRNAASGFTLGNKGYMLCGWIENSPSKLGNETWEWDQATDTWTQKADFPAQARNGASSFSIGANSYIIGGWIDGDSTVFSKQFWKYQL